MAKGPGAGKKAGVKKVDAETYLPEPGDWEETNVLWDFGDGWLICDDRTEYDRRLNAKLTLTCVGGMTHQCRPADTTALDAQLEQHIKRLMEGRFAVDRKTAEEQAKRQLAYMYQQAKKACYRIMHVRDPEGRPRACILALLAEAKRSPGAWGAGSYTSSNDLGQDHPIVIDGEEYFILEVRIGTGKASPQVAEDRVIEWYTQATGKWNEESYLLHKVTAQHYAAVTAHPTNMNQFRRKEPAHA